MQAIGGRLYPPLQYVSFVDVDGSAYEGGVRLHDRILEVNDSDVAGASHKLVVQHVLNGGDHLKLRVVRVDATEAARLQRIEEAGETGNAAKPMALVKPKYLIKGFENMELPKPHTVFQIYFGPNLVCKKRFSEFEALHKALVKRFRWFSFPEFPAKKVNGLSFFNMALTDRELKERKEKLHVYLSKVMAADDISNSSLVKEFLGDHSTDDGANQTAIPDASEPAKRQIILPDPDADEDDEEETAEAPKPAAAKLFANVMDDDDDDLIPVKKPTAKKNAAAEEAQATKSAAAIEKAAQAHKKPDPPHADPTPEPEPEVATQEAAPAPAAEAKYLDVEPEPATSKPPAAVSVDEGPPADDGGDEEEAEPIAAGALAEEPAEEVAGEEEEEDDDVVVVTKPPEKIKVLYPHLDFFPDGKTFKVEIAEKGATTAEVEAAMVAKMGMGEFGSNLFGLFEVVDMEYGQPEQKMTAKTFERKLTADEIPDECAGALVVRKWLFYKAQEKHVEEDEPCIDLLFAQSIYDARRDRFSTSPIEEKLQAHEDAEEKPQYLKMARKLAAYGGLTFKYCTCDFFEDDSAPVLVTVDIKAITFTKCDAEYTALEDTASNYEEPTKFEWDIVTKWKVTDLTGRNTGLLLTYETGDGDSEDVHISTCHARYLHQAIERVATERSWGKANAAGDERAPDNFFQ